MDQRKKNFILRELRRSSLKWPARNQVKSNARVARGQYKCAKCKDIFHYKEVHVDHIDPVIPTDGWDSWEEVLERMFCSIDEMQLLCKGCHKKKTNKENKNR